MKSRGVYNLNRYPLNQDTDTGEYDALIKSIESWQESVSTVGFVNYLKGVAAYDIGDKKEAIYRFMAVKENCEKTVFFGMAEQHLAKLK